jgi:hypothetical protein
MHEQRKDSRVPLRLELRWDGYSGRIPAVTSDISLGGCYVESLTPVTIGEILYFDFRPATSESLRLQGPVLYRHQNIGFGVRFTDLNARQERLKLILLSSPGNETRSLPGPILASPPHNTTTKPVCSG